MPKSLAVAAIQGESVVSAIARKSETRGCGQHAGPSSLFDVMAPANFSGLIIDGFDHGFAPKSIITASPSVCAVCRLGKIDRIRVARRDDERSGFRIETWRAKVGCAAFVGSDKTPVGCWLFVRIGNWAALFVYFTGPV